MFLRDLEEDDEMRAGVNLWKAPARSRNPDVMDVESEAGDTDVDDDDMPKSTPPFDFDTFRKLITSFEVSVDELLDEMAEMTIHAGEEPPEAEMG